jgi:hypothetical protein
LNSPNDAQRSGPDEPGAPEVEHQWGLTAGGIAARAAVASYFSECVHLAEAGLLEQAERRLARGAWRRVGVDLTGAPTDLIYRTDVLVSRANALARYGDPAEFGSVMSTVLQLWS